MPDVFVVALNRLLFWALGAPAQAGEEPADVVNVIAHAKFLFDQIANPRATPEIIGEAGGLGALEKKPFQSCNLCNRKAARRSGSWF